MGERKSPDQSRLVRSNLMLATFAVRLCGQAKYDR
jgi:hypothetical protein